LCEHGAQRPLLLFRHRDEGLEFVRLQFLRFSAAREVLERVEMGVSPEFSAGVVGLVGQVGLNRVFADQPNQPNQTEPPEV
jgi:hypothetical protein